MNWLVAHYQDIINIVVSIFVIARIIVKITPTPADDSFLEKIIAGTKHLGLQVPDEKQIEKK